jgi:hypothetical protein
MSSGLCVAKIGRGWRIKRKAPATVLCAMSSKALGQSAEQSGTLCLQHRQFRNCDHRLSPLNLVPNVVPKVPREV